jgi:hypothetical protein
MGKFSDSILFSVFVLFILQFLLIPQHSNAQPANQDSLYFRSDSLIVKLDESTYLIGNLKLNRISKEIEIPGNINMNKGLIEYFAVTEYGKTHEAVVVLNIQPMHLQIALLLFGLNYGQNLEFQGDSVVPQGDSVYIDLLWVDKSGDTISYSASELIKDYRTQKIIPPTAWIFTGSALFEGNFLADIDGSIVATYSDPAALLNNPLDGRMDDTVYGANEEILPEPGTEVVMKIKVPD